MAALDNPAWSALSGTQRMHAECDAAGRALRYRPDVSSIAAVESLDRERWQSLGDLVGVGGIVVQARVGEVVAPPGWGELMLEPSTQYIADAARVEQRAQQERQSLRVEPLGPADVGAMLALVEQTRPGPFRPRSLELGRWFGARRDGKLLAMAGERMQADSFSEISGVCVHQQHRRQGFATALVAQLAACIAEEGRDPVLHVRRSNIAARALCRSLGFAERSSIVVAAHRRMH